MIPLSLEKCWRNSAINSSQGPMGWVWLRPMGGCGFYIGLMTDLHNDIRRLVCSTKSEKKIPPYSLQDVICLYIILYSKVQLYLIPSEELLVVKSNAPISPNFEGYIQSLWSWGYNPVISKSNYSSMSTISHCVYVHWVGSHFLQLKKFKLNWASRKIDSG